MVLIGSSFARDILISSRIVHDKLSRGRAGVVADERFCPPTTVYGFRYVWMNEDVRADPNLSHRLSFRSATTIYGSVGSSVVRCALDDCVVLEQLCRYITRPALANERIQPKNSSYPSAESVGGDVGRLI